MILWRDENPANDVSLSMGENSCKHSVFGRYVTTSTAWKNDGAVLVVPAATPAIAHGAAGFQQGKRATTNASAYELLVPYCSEVVRPGLSETIGFLQAAYPRLSIWAYTFKRVYVPKLKSDELKGMPVVGDFVVRSIREDEIGLFASILQEAAQWLRQQGREMWTPEQLEAERLLKHNAIHEMYIGWVNGVPAATMILQESDPVMWPEHSVRSDSLYLHKLSVRRAYAKTGCSTMMIEWAKKEAKRRNKTFLRLDCAADRPKLCSFYEKHGFRKVGERLILQKFPTALFEWNRASRSPE